MMKASVDDSDAGKDLPVRKHHRQRSSPCSTTNARHSAGQPGSPHHLDVIEMKIRGDAAQPLQRDGTTTLDSSPEGIDHAPPRRTPLAPWDTPLTLGRAAKILPGPVIPAPGSYRMDDLVH